MPARFAQPSTHGRSSHSDDSDNPEFRWEIDPGDPIAPPPRSRRGRTLIRLLAVALVAGGGWMLVSERPQLTAAAFDWLASAMTNVRTALTPVEPANPGAPEPLAQLTPMPVAARPPDVGQPLQTENSTAMAAATTEPGASQSAPLRTINSQPETGADTAGESVNDASQRSASVSSASAAGNTHVNKVINTEPAQVPTPSIDPLRKRAEAVGLHPDLSSALLEHLSKKDLANAKIAIDTALKKTPDNSVYVWPLKKKTGLARFRIHFVAGAALNCRRYVVTVAKDGWLTTALPMQRCGVKAPD